MAQPGLRLIRAAVAAVPLGVVALFFCYPVLGMVGRGFAPDGHLDLAGVWSELVQPRTLQVLWFTVWSAAAGTVVALVAGLPLAYALYRLDFPGRTLARGVVLVPFVLPTVVVGVAFGQLLVPSGWLGFLHADGTAGAIVAALAFFNVSVVVRTVGTFWESLDARRGEAAASLGAGPLQVFRTVTLPALMPGILGAASVVFLFCSTAFGVVLTMGGLRYANVETEIWLLTTQELDLSGAAGLSILQMAVVVALLWLTHLSRRDVPVDRVRRPAGRPTRAHAPVLLWAAMVIGLLLLPLAALLDRSLQGQHGWTLDNYRALTTTGDSQTLAVPATQALVNSLQIALYATVLSMLLGAIVAVLTSHRSRSRWGRRLDAVLDGLFMLPLGVSAVTLGFGFLITLNHPPVDFRFSPWLIPIAQAMVALPLVVRTLLPVLRGIDPRQREAAASLGASPAQVFWAVDLPVAWRAFAASAGFAFAVSLGEFGATSFLVRDDFPTLPVVIYRLFSHPGIDNAGMAMAASVLLAGTTAAVTLTVERLRVGSMGAF